MDDEPSNQQTGTSRAGRIGLVLFAVYVVFYAGFMGLSAFAPDVMSSRPLGGVNLAIDYGMGLILGAFVLALLYMALARKS
ncbi:MAG: DUF485 domain-containing protein [Phycisphaerales bacterium]|nr:DUF485 domain-containing protein [Phycisphaerales bacterium]